jgi:hypothetical protein
MDDNMQKRFFIVHGWGGSPEGNWFPWLRDMLESRGLAVYLPRMPNAHNPVEGEWVKALDHDVGTLDGNTYFIGHSLGCITILRYLEQIGGEQVAGGCVLVAGFSGELGIAQIQNFLAKPVDWRAVKSHCSKFVSIASDNDPYVPLKYSVIFKRELAAKCLIQPGMGHFQMKELHVALNELLKLSA